MHRCLFALGLALLLAPGSASALIIDSFDDNSSVSADGLPLGSPDSDTTPSGSFLGTGRVLEATWTSGANSVDAEIDAAGDSQLNISLGADTLGDISVLWQNIPNVDLTEGGDKNGIALAIAFADVPATITLLADDGTNSGSASVGSPGSVFSCCTTQGILFSSFSGSVDFTSIDSFELVITATIPALDMQLNFIESSVVPEPGTAALLLTGLAGLAVRRRRPITR